MCEHVVLEDQPASSSAVVLAVGVGHSQLSETLTVSQIISRELRQKKVTITRE